MIEQRKSQSVNDGRRAFWKQVSLFFIPLAILVSLLLLGFYWYTSNNSLRVLEERERNIVKLYHDNLGVELGFILTDIQYLSNQHELQDFIDSGFTENKDLARDYSTFSKEKGLYDQIRFLDRTGMERIRINYNNGKPAVVPLDSLQNKANRYYFSDAFKLPKNAIFISPLDLNIEKKTIEIPQKPMIRLGMPVFDKNGKKQGVLLLNFLAQKILDSFHQWSQRQSGESMLLNKDGYWLQGATKEDEWGFMYQDRKDITFKNRYPDEWDDITRKGRGQVRNKNGLFTFEVIKPLKSVTNEDGTLNDYHWIIVSRIAPETLSEQSKVQRQTLIFSSLILACLLFSLAIIRTRSAIAQTQYQESIERKNAELQDQQKRLQSAVSELIESNNSLNKTVHDLEKALTEIKTLRGILPICSYCKEIRNDKGYWIRIENYIEQHSQAEFSHGICDKCLQEYFPEEAEELDAADNTNTNEDD